jgi:hypothetical protein
MPTNRTPKRRLRKEPPVPPAVINMFLKMKKIEENSLCELTCECSSCHERRSLGISIARALNVRPWLITRWDRDPYWAGLLMRASTSTRSQL